MPCEACNTQFTVFKRKKSCSECRRLYCSNCLTKNKERIICKRCVIFTTRPLLKIELLKLKAKDLIFYLQSKHISTTGCVEKEELVNLVLIHVDNSQNFSPDSQSSTLSGGTNDGMDDGRSNPFDQIRNTCQNLFTTFTEKIAADLNFDMKPNQNDRPTNVCEQQPRYSSANMRQPTSYTQNHVPADSNSNNQHQRPTTMTPGTQLPSYVSLQHSPNQTTSTSTSSGSSTPSVFQSTSQAIDDHDSVQNPVRSFVSTAGNDASQQIVDNSSRNEYEPSASKKFNATNNNKLHRTKCKHLSELSQCSGGGGGSGCECSDDELITKFQKKYRDKSLDSITKSTTIGSAKTKTIDGINSDKEHFSASTATSSSTKTGNTSDTQLKDDASAIENSDVSSVEDLGAVGGANINSCDTDKWQIINIPWQVDDTASTSSVVTEDAKQFESIVTIAQNTTILPNSIIESDTNQRQKQQNSREDSTFPQHVHSISRPDLVVQLEKAIHTARHSNRKLTRRRSDGIIYMASTSNATRTHCRENFLDDLDNGEEVDYDNDQNLSSTSDAMLSHKRSKKSCQKCGKTKGDLRKYIARFRHQLETTTDFSETEIKQQLDAFLKFLESRSRNSFDYKEDNIVEQRAGGSDVETTVLRSPTQIDTAEAIERPEYEIEIDDFDDDNYAADDDDDDDDDDDENAGIHVYGTNDVDAAIDHAPSRQFFNLNNIERKEKLDKLTVKQLKEVLMLNRVDFKGCCEKSELLERVQRLWDDLQNCPAVDKLPTDDLCKICMDAAIECVLLECGHMATCTNCGKVLSECPICRQYIVRVVRFFKA